MPDLYLPASPRPKPDEQIMTWQPIETAPKDGTPVILAHTDGLTWRVGEARWTVTGAYMGGPGMGHGKLYGWDESWSGLKPTHWMPLPPPPAGTDPNPTA